VFEEITIAVVSGVVLMLVGTLGTAVAWLAREAWKMKRDLDIAHDKIRQTDKHLECLERAFYFEGDEDGDNNRYYREPPDSNAG